MKYIGEYIICQNGILKFIYLFIYLANMCGRGQCTTTLSAVPFQLAIGLIPYP
jgi:hypothetical protein